MIDLYEILQCHRSADHEVIAAVYKRLAAKYHPDNAVSGDADRFKEICAAFEVLGNATHRAAYDRERNFQNQTAETDAPPDADVTFYRGESLPELLQVLGVSWDRSFNDLKFALLSGGWTITNEKTEFTHEKKGTINFLASDFVHHMSAGLFGDNNDLQRVYNAEIAATSPQATMLLRFKKATITNGVSEKDSLQTVSIQFKRQAV